MSSSLIHRDLGMTDPDLVANGLRRMIRWLSSDTVTNKRPVDFDQRRAELADLEQKLLDLSASDNEVLRELASDALGAFLGDAALDRLLVLAQDPEERVRASAVGALEGWPDETRARGILLASAAAGHWTVRMRATRALQAYTGDDVIEVLMESLLDPDSYVRLAAADSLRRRDAALFRQRLRLLADYQAPHHLDAAIDLMGEVGTAEDAQFLSKVGGWFNLSQPAFIRQWARKSARKIRTRMGQ